LLLLFFVNEDGGVGALPPGPAFGFVVIGDALPWMRLRADGSFLLPLRKNGFLPGVEVAEPGVLPCVLILGLSLIGAAMGESSTVF
jgi:hypothetical protein